MPMSRFSGGTRFIGRPLSEMMPWVGASNPASIISVVVLPEPDGPSKVRNSPRRIWRLRFLTTSVTPSKVFCTSENATRTSFSFDISPRPRSGFWLAGTTLRAPALASPPSYGCGAAGSRRIVGRGRQPASAHDHGDPEQHQETPGELPQAGVDAKGGGAE